MINYTAKYTKIACGYMGRLVEWPEVVTEGKDLEDCRSMLRDALNEMVIAYNKLGKEIPFSFLRFFFDRLNPMSLCPPVR